MQFIRTRYSFCGFDGKTIVVAELDRPAAVEGRREEYLSRYANGCYNFVSRELLNAINDIYLSEYNNGISFHKYFYKLEITETYSCEDTLSILISASLRRSGATLCNTLDSYVFCGDCIVPPRIIVKRYRGDHGAVILNNEGIASYAKLYEGCIIFKTVGKSKFS